MPNLGEALLLLLLLLCVLLIQEILNKTQSYVGKTERHLAVRVQEHLSGKSGKCAIHEHISSCKDCHSCSISNFYTSAHANTDFE